MSIPVDELIKKVLVYVRNPANINNGNIDELEKRLIVFQNLLSVYQEKLDTVNRASYPDKMYKFRLTSAIEDTRSIISILENTIQQLRGNISEKFEFDRRLSQQAEQIKQFQSLLTQKQAEIQKKEADVSLRINAFQEQETRQKAEIQKKEQELTAFRTEQPTLINQIEQLQKELTELQAEHNVAVAQKTVELNERQQEVVQLQAQIQQLLADNKSVEEKRAQLDTEQKALTARVGELLEQKAQLQTQCNTREAEFEANVSQLRKELSKEKDKFALVLSEKEELEESINRLSVKKITGEQQQQSAVQQVSSLQAQFQELSDSKAQCEAASVELSSELERLRAEQKSFQELLDKKEQELDQKTKAYELLFEEKDVLNAKIEKNKKLAEETLQNHGEINKQLGSAQIELLSVQSDVKTLTSSLAETERQLNAEKAKAQIAEVAIKDVQAKNSEILGKIKTLEAQLATKNNTISDQNFAMEKQKQLIDTLNNSNASYEAEINSIRTRLATFQSTVEEKQQLSTKYTAELEQKTQELIQKQQLVQSLQQQQSEKQTEIDRITAENAECLAEKKRLIERIRELENQINTLNEQIDTISRENRTLQNNNEVLTEQISQLDAEKNQYKRQAEEFKLGFDQASSTVSRLSEQSLAYEEQLQSLRKRLEECNQKAASVDKKQQELDALTAQSIELKKTHKSQLDSASREIRKLSTENDDLKKVIKQVEADSFRYQETLKLVNGEIARKNSEIGMLTQERNTIRTESQQERQKSKEIQQKTLLRMADLTTQLGQASKDLKLSQTALDTIKTQSTQNEQEVAVLKKQEQEYSELVSSLRKEIDTLQQQLSSINSQLDTEKGFRSKYEELRSELEAEKSKYNQEVAEFNQAIELVKNKLGLSDIKSAQLDEFIRNVKAKDVKISDIESNLNQNRQLIANLTSQVSAEKELYLSLNRKLQSDLEQAQTTISSLESEKSSKQSQDALLQNQKVEIETKLREAQTKQERVDKELESEKSVRKILEQQLQQLSDKNTVDLKNLQECEQALQLNQAELQQKNTLIIKLQEQLDQLAPEKKIAQTEESQSSSTLSNMLLEKVDQEQQIVDLTQQLTTLRKLVQDILSTYIELTKSVVTIPFDMATNYGQGTSIGSYILSTVLLFHIWKTVLRIPILLRSDGSEYLYLLPDNVRSSKLFSIIPSELQDVFISKITPDQRMRIDIILYFLISGLVEYKNGISNGEPLTEVYKYIEKMVEYTTKNLYDIMNTLRKKSSTEIRNKPNRMITFVRISSTTPTTSERFKVNVVNQRTMNIQYSDQPIPFYELDKKNASEWVRNTTPINYNADYWFGPFTKIYNTTDSNRGISEDQVFREQIEAQLRQLKPVCIIGHGAPGSGKTTTLIHANYTTVEKGIAKNVNEHGILLLLADQLSKDAVINGVPYQKFDECQVAIYELAANTSSSTTQSVCYKYPESENPLQDNRSLITSSRESDNYTRKFVEGTVSYDNCEDSTTRYIYTIGKNGTWTDIEGKGMDRTMLDAIDKNRNIASTNSNPQSSRSHTICILTFLNKQTSQITTLIVCDFAGGENKFNCSDPKELDKIGVPTLVELEKKRIIKGMTQSVQYPELQEGIINGSLLSNIIGIPILSLKKYIELSQYVKRITDLFSKKIKIKVTSSKQKDDPYNTYSSWFETGKKPVSTATEVPLDISLITNYKLVETANAQNSFPKKSYINLYYGFIIDPDNKALLQLLIKLYSSFTNDTSVNNITDLLIPELVKLIVWFNHSFNHYNLMFHSLLSLHVNPNTKSLLTEEEIKKGVKIDLCNIRNKEGVFINYTLNQFRDFISNLLRSSSNSSNEFSFIDECASIQCNPYYRDCFGQNPYGATSSEPNPNNYGELSKYIMNVPNSSKMIFCIINILNLSKPVNNPPPTPYIDSTELMIERERMKNYLSSTLRTEEFALRLSKPTISPDILKRFIRNPLLVNMPEEFKKIVLSLANDLLNKIGQPIEKLDALIQSIENSNGVTSIGTMKFIDDMSKGGYTAPICNLNAH